MKKVYLMSVCVDDEYGCRECRGVFATREGAEAAAAAWTAEEIADGNCQPDGTLSAWFGNIPLCTVEEMELQA